MKDFNTKELQTAKEIINSGLLKAAESLSFFMKEPITLRDFDSYEDWGAPAIELEEKENPNIHFLVTEVIGELKGICCLIFTENEANQLRRTALPEEILANPAMMAEMSDAIMLEVDNIISASVITKFSNILKHKIYGGVPSLQKMTSDEVNDFIRKQSAEGMYVINFKTNFVSAKGNFSPEFIWMFDQSFGDSIKRFSSSDNLIEK